MAGPIPGTAATLPIEELVARGESVVGTPEDAIAQIRRLESKVPNFGGLLVFDRNLTRMEHKKKSLEMLMRHVLPVINGDNVNRVKSYEFTEKNREKFVGLMMEGAQRAFDKHSGKK
jgi:limonene 1,2-monooxygenase